MLSDEIYQPNLEQSYLRLMVDLHRPKVDRGNEKDLAFVWELWLSGYCTGIPVTDPRLIPWRKPVFLIPYLLFTCVSLPSITTSITRSTKNIYTQFYNHGTIGSTCIVAMSRCMLI